MNRPPEFESRLESFFQQRVRNLGGIAVKIAPTLAGIPDRLVLLPGGGMYLVELKTTAGPLRPIQRHLHTRIEELGTPVYVLRGRADVIVWLRDRVEELSQC